MQCLSVEEQNEMTLQVGLVGSDGIVIASDRQVSDLSHGGRGLTESSKIQQYDGVVCCWSGGYPAARAVDCMRDIQWGTIGNRGNALRECGKRAWGNSGRSHGADRVLAAFSDGELLDLTVSDVCGVTPISDQVVNGDRFSTARHLATMYTPKKRPEIQHLIFLAAHIVLMAGRENPAGIAGLQVAVIPRGAPPILLTESQENELKTLSDSIHARLGKELLQPFDFRSVAPPRS